jgi:phage repressor protein C with HTH and peptisase S24 domain
MKYSVLLATLQNLNILDFVPKQNQFCKILDITPASMSARVKRDTEFTEEELQKLEEFWAVSIPRDISSEIELDYYPDVFGSCGSGAFVLSETKESISVPRKSFLTRVMPNVSNFKKYSVINAVGDSMQPFIYENDKLIVEHFDGGQIKDNKIYVFCYENEIFVKRLVKNITQVVIKSDNTLYDPIKIDGKDPNFMIIGEIVGMLRDLS